MKWPTVQLGEVISIARDAIQPAAIPSGTHYVGLENITGEGQFTEVRPVQNGELASAKFAFTPAHVLYGKLRPYLRKTARPCFEGICSTDILPILPGPRIDRDYLYHYLRRPEIVELATTRSSGANLPRISPNVLREFELPLPPLAEQKRIAAILDKADALRRKRREAIAKLDTLLQSVFLEMFGDPVRNPNGWPVRSLQELINPSRPLTYGILMPGPDWDGGVPYVRVVDIKDGKINLATVRRTSPEIASSYKRSILREGDLLLSIRGHVGRMAMVPSQLDGGNITQDTARIAVSGINSCYVRSCLETKAMQDFMRRQIKGVAVQGINLGDVKLLPIPIPPRDLQEKFSKFAASWRGQMLIANSSICQVDELFGSLQLEHFGGQ